MRTESEIKTEMDRLIKKRDEIYKIVGGTDISTACRIKNVYDKMIGRLEWVLDE
jgi:hypothetical protein